MDEAAEARMFGLLDVIAVEVAGLRVEMRSEFADVRTEMRSEFADVRTEMRSGFFDVCSEMRSGLDRVERRVGRLETRVEDLENKSA